MLKGKLKFLGIFVLGLIAGIGILIVLGELGSFRMAVAPGEDYDFEGRQGLTVENPLGAPSFDFAKEEYSASTEDSTSETESRLVIKTGLLNMVVEDVSGSAQKIINYAKEKSGWVVSSSISEQEDVPSGRVTVRVPVENFDESIAYFRGLAEKVTHESTQGQDVTEEYTDLESQLRNLEATEAQLLKIMERSGTILEVLEVQRELTKVRNNIEVMKGRMQYLERSAKMATITVNLALSEELLPIPPAEKWRPVYVFKQSWRNILGTLRGISYLVIWLGVYGIIWVPLIIIVWFIRKLWKKINKPPEI